ncbi:MAG: SLBB domain-containing protein, partial [Candidatus Auribacterota bacterium]|nr:SLBB domain-containing protein [Candidatus Auribacterota bacterium]
GRKLSIYSDQSNMSSLAQQVKEAGVVGCGGAGFPTHVKVGAKAEYVIANGAECEPLLRVDQQLMIARAAEVIMGLELLTEAVGATHPIIALKEKYQGAIDALRTEIARRHSRVELFLLGGYYPAGDEQVLVYDVTGRLVPEGGIPMDVGVVVDNVGTLINIYQASRSIPVTHRFLTITGEVKNPVTLSVPVGAFVEDIIAVAGGTTVDEYEILDGGPIMGAFTSGYVSKKTTGLIVLPKEHKQVLYKQRTIEIDIKRASWACDQCRACTDMCPRYLLGHRIEPHIIMRMVGQQRADAIPPDDLAGAYLCCQCGLCGMFACPTTISPDKVIAALLDEMKNKDVQKTLLRDNFEAHPIREGRKIPVSRIARRIDVLRYDNDAPLQSEPLSVTRVRIALHQNVGVPCQPEVKVSDRVEEGMVIGSPPDDALGAPIHASIGGVVEQIFEDSIFIRAR